MPAAMGGLRRRRTDKLEAIDLSHNHIRSVCPQLWLKPRLRYACLAQGSLGDVPGDVLSKQYVEDCLPRLRAYLSDNADKEGEPVPISR
jgi:hypothetical protein